ncbi:DeoR family transcriptional regulator [Limnohabitans sp. TS-CS-82]|uniref:DeoR family transcriptional regulator n=1 Tax=Limnohabitans sp. TS-CS-82 TaxID=2094193 RepID=UPI001F002946|nr:DeoR family transcriptional regulator [Limnohabitans sp. TS-CS-82]
MLKAARQKEIVALLQGGGVVEVSVLAERFQTSPITVRRDLIELQERGVLARTRGGRFPATRCMRRVGRVTRA